MLTYYTYILFCSDKTYYVGQTQDLDHRLKQHNGLLPGGARYTQARKPVILQYVEEYTNRSLAMQREYILKKLTRKQKEKLCAKK